MAIANGSVQSPDGLQLKCVFTVDEVEYKFAGNLVKPAMTPFATTKATLTYDAISSLVGPKAFNGRLGVNDVQLNIGDGADVSVSGTLKSPIEPATNIYGVGAWTGIADG